MRDKLEVVWFDRRRSTVDTVWDLYLHRVIAFAPHSTVLSLGRNDLDSGERVAGDCTASSLIALTQILMSAKQIYVCCVLPWLKPQSADPSVYAEAVRSCSNTLQLLLKGSDLNRQAYPGVHYWRIRRLAFSQRNIFFVMATSGCTITFSTPFDLLWVPITKMPNFWPLRIPAHIQRCRKISISQYNLFGA